MQRSDLITINDDKLGDILSQNGLTIILVTSSWDGYGIIMRSLLERKAVEYGNIRFCVADVETSPKLCRLFNVTAPPGLLLVRNGELIDHRSGAMGGNAIGDFIEQNS